MPVGSDRHTLVLAPALSESSRVRAFLRRLADDLHFPPDRSFDIQVAVCEAVANAIEHAHGTGEVQVEATVLADRLEVAVRGMGEFHLPAQRDGREHRGLGLPLMAALADHLALYSAADGGTLVALTFYLPGAAPTSARPPSLAELLAESRLLPQVLNNLPDAFVVFDQDWRYAFVNDAHVALSKKPRKELLGRSFLEVFPEALTVRDENGVNVYEEYRRAREQGRPSHFFFRYQPFGRWFEYHVFPVTEGLAVFARDATDELVAEETLQASEQRYRALADAIADPFFALDQELVITYWNRASEATVGLQAEQVLGRRLLDVFPELAGGRIERLYREVLASHQAQSLEDRWDRPQGTSYHDVRVYPTTEGLAVLLRDITARRRSEERLAFQAGLLESVQDAVVATDAQMRVNYWSPRAEQMFGWSAEEALGQETADLFQVAVPDTSREEAVRQLLEAARYEGEVSYRRKDGSHFPAEVRAAVMRDPHGEMTGLVTSVRDITQRKLAQDALANAALFPEENPFPVLRVTEEGTLIYANLAAAPLMSQWGSLVGHPVPASVMQAAGLALRTGEGQEIEVEVGERSLSLVLVPVLRGCYVNFYGRDVTERKQAEQEREEQHRLANALVHLTQAIAGSSNLAEMLDQVVDEAAEPMGVDSVGIWLREGEEWVLAHAAGPSAEYLGGRVPSSEVPLSMLACETGRVQYVEDVPSSDRVEEEAVQARGVRSFLVAPLVPRGEAIGVLEFSHHSVPVRFTHAQVDFAENLAASLSLALENARLYETQKHIADTLQESLLRLPAILPDLEVDSLYRSATEEALVGGDFYDAFPIHRYLVGLVVGDFCGHGVEAASIASVVRDTFRAYAFQGLPLGEVLALANDAIIRQTEASAYTTLFAAFLNTRTGVLDYCSAGHPPALVRRSTGEVEELAVFGPPLGAFPDTSYYPGRTTFRIGELLLLYTDGLIEARTDGSFFGEHSLADLLRSHGDTVKGLSQKLLNAATAFAGDRLHDDVALLAVARKGGKGLDNSR